MDPDQLASLVNRVDQSRPLLKWPADQDPHCFQCKIELVIIDQNMNSTGPKGGGGLGGTCPPPPPPEEACECPKNVLYDFASIFMGKITYMITDYPHNNSAERKGGR